MTFKDDLAADIIGNHLNVEEFGETVQYIPAADYPIFDIQVIFDESYEGIDAESGQIVNSRQPKITARQIDFENEPAQGDIIERDGGAQYKVSKYLPDGTGIAEILLHKVET